MSVTRVPAMQHTPGTACRSQVGASAAFVKLALQVSVGNGAGLGSCLCSPTVADPATPAYPGARCQTMLSPCESQPCQHGGQCLPSQGPGGALTFACHCIPVSGGGWSLWSLGDEWEHGLMGRRGFRREEVEEKGVSGKS